MADPFAADYTAARAEFLAAVRRAGGRTAEFTLQGVQGPGGEELATTTGWLGSNEPQAVLIVTSGTHGVEGFTGSALQIRIAESAGATAHKDPAILLVHAINPYGFAHTRRVNERNVDLNRNFVDFSRPMTTGRAYAMLHPFLVPADWDGESRKVADRALALQIDRLGIRRFQQAVCEGQYEFADGLFYGGQEAAWSNLTWRKILAQLPSCVRWVGHIDLHTGLGPFGYGEILYTLSGDGPAYELAREWYYDLGMQPSGADASAATDVVGTMNNAVLALGPARSVCSVTLEFGTVSVDRMIEAVRADNWLHFHGQVDSLVGAAIKRELRDCFLPEAPAWRDAVLARGLEVVERTRHRLSLCTRAA